MTKNHKIKGNQDKMPAKHGSVHLDDLDLVRGYRNVTLSASDQRRRILIVGDIHGCLPEFEQLLAENHEPNDTIILAGDLVNKGPDSAGVVRLARELRCHAVVGNHELSSLRGYHARGGGARPEAEPKYAWTDALEPVDVEYLSGLPYTIELPLHRALVVHAGLVPGVPLGEQKRVDMVAMRNLVAVDRSLRREQLLALAMARHARLGAASPARELPADALRLIFECVLAVDAAGVRWLAREKDAEGGRPWASVWSLWASGRCAPLRRPTHVYFGHDAKRQLQRWEHATGLDTGCLYGRELTAAVLELGMPPRLVSVPAQRAYVGVPASHGLPERPEDGDASGAALRAHPRARALLLALVAVAAVAAIAARRWSRR